MKGKKVYIAGFTVIALVAGVAMTVLNRRDKENFEKLYDKFSSNISIVESEVGEEQEDVESTTEEVVESGSVYMTQEEFTKYIEDIQNINNTETVYLNDILPQEKCDTISNYVKTIYNTTVKSDYANNKDYTLVVEVPVKESNSDNTFIGFVSYFSEVDRDYQNTTEYRVTLTGNAEAWYSVEFITEGFNNEVY